MTIIVTFLILIVVLIIFLAFSIVYSNKEKLEKISFKESMDLTGFPIVTFYIGENKLNFILDTGSNVSYINKDCLSDIPYKKIDKVTYVTGFQADEEPKPFAYFEFYYKENKFEDEFCVVDLSPSFSQIKQQSGVVLHGLLGSNFFQKYRYVLNFDELKAYSKK